MNKAELDPKVIPLVEFFNAEGLPTLSSCEGHDKTYMSMFWIKFDYSVTEEDIITFQQRHLTKRGSFISCGRFAKRVFTMNLEVFECWCYFAATVEAADTDLGNWTTTQTHTVEEFGGRKLEDKMADKKRTGFITKAIKMGFIFIGLLSLITVGWQIVELQMFGEIRPNEVDTIIAILIALLATPYFAR